MHAALADEGEALVQAHRPAHAQVLGRDRTIGVLPDDDEALLRPQHVHGLGAIGGEVEFLARRDHLLQHAHGVVGRYVDLVGEFAGEGDAEHPRRYPAHLAFLPGHEGEGGVVQIDVGQLGQQLAAVGTGQGQGRPVVGDRGEVHLQLRPFGLVVQLQPFEDARGAAGGGGHQEVVVGETGGDAVVEDHAVFLAHQAVAGLADVQLGPGVGVDAVEEFPRVLALDVDLAQGRGVEQADAAAHGQALAIDRGMQVLARLGEVPGALPLADVLEQRALLEVPGVQRGVALGLEQGPAVATGDGAKGHRGVVRAEHGGADFRDGLALHAGGDGQAVDVAQLALVGAEAHGGVALDVLDGLEALAAGQLDAGGGHVVLQVDELLGGPRRRLVVGHLEQRQTRLFLTEFGLGQLAADHLGTGFGRGGGAGLETVGQDIAQGEDAIHATGAEALLRRRTGHEGLDVIAPQRTTAQVRGQVDHRAVAAGGGDEVAIEPLTATQGTEGGQIDGGDLGAGHA
ncbi:hypothetical protein COLO4_02038, partial [Corchorus olitorius]